MCFRFNADYKDRWKVRNSAEVECMRSWTLSVLMRHLLVGLIQRRTQRSYRSVGISAGDSVPTLAASNLLAPEAILLRVVTKSVPFRKRLTSGREGGREGGRSKQLRPLWR